MSRGPSLSPLIAKEFRALLPVWGATMLALVAALVWRHRAYSDIGLIAYVGGTVALGAHAVGHEYGHRTLPMLLAQPVPRRRVFAIKFLAAGSLLITLAIAAAAVFMTDRRRTGVGPLIGLPILAGLFITPLTTMICRSTLAGAVLGVSGPMMAWVLTILISWWAFGVYSDPITAWLLDRWLLASVIVCPALAALSWRAFNRVEAVDGLPLALTLPRLGARTGVRRAARWRALIWKEIQLQQMTIAITLLYGVIWLIGILVRETIPKSVILPMEAVLLLYCLGLTIVIGALASAEERQLGTHEIQLLQPVSALAQWAIKCAVTLGLAIALGFVLPVALIAAFSDSILPEFSTTLVLLVIMLTSSSLYISSLTSSGVKAMAWSLPVSLGAAIFIQTMQSTIVLASRRLGTPLPVDQSEASIVAAQLLFAPMVAMLLWFGYVNHISAEHPWRRGLMQAGVLALLIVTGIVAGGALM